MTAFDHNNPQQRDQAVKATLAVSFELLGEDSSRYRELAIFPEDVNIPLLTVQKLWSATGGHALDDFDIDTICGHLRRLSLLLDFDPVKRSIRLHDVIRAYLQQELGESVLVALQGQFLDAYRMQRWTELPESEPYLWDHLRLLKHNVTNMSHLLNACQTFDEVAVTLLSRLAHLDELAEQCQALQQRLSRPFLIPWHTLPSLPDPALIRTLQGHTKTVHSCAISPAGDWVVSASWDGTLKVWNARTGAKLLTL